MRFLPSKQCIKKLFGMKASVGDEVKGYLDWGIEYEGVVIEDNSNDRYFPTYTVEGKTIIHTHWNGDIVEKGTFTVSPLRIVLK